MQNAFIIKDTISFRGSSFKKNLTNEKAVPFFFISLYTLKPKRHENISLYSDNSGIRL